MPSRFVTGQCEGSQIRWEARRFFSINHKTVNQKKVSRTLTLTEDLDRYSEIKFDTKIQRITIFPAKAEAICDVKIEEFDLLIELYGELGDGKVLKL